MRATLLEYLAMTPEQAARVTHIDCTDAESAAFLNPRDDAEEWPGEREAMERRR